MEPVQYVAFTINLCVQIFKKWREQGGRLTRKQKNGILLMIEILTGQLFRCISDLRSELGEFGGEFEVPRIQYGHLEYECTDAHDQGDAWNPLGEPSIPG